MIESFARVVHSLQGSFARHGNEIYKLSEERVKFSEDCSKDE